MAYSLIGKNCPPPTFTTGVTAAASHALPTTAIIMGLAFLPILASAHHNVAGRYDPQQVIEVEGVVSEIIWRNPHVQITMRATEANGDDQVWDMATTALSNMRRWQIDPDFIAVGDTIRVAGNPARRGVGMYISNVLTPDGQEVLLGPNVESLWSDRTIEIAASRRALIGDATAPELGIFRVWSHPEGVGMLIPQDVNPNYDLEENYPLTTTAMAAVSAFVREQDNPIAFCQPKGMPTIMEAPYPHRFVQDGENILWHMEEYDTIRTIHMAPDATAEGKPAARLGYSIGRWEDENSLVVTTTNSTWGYFDTAGIPLSEDAVIAERFTVASDGSRLDFAMTVSDPATFTEPVTLTKFWLYFAGEEVGRYACSTAAED